MRLTVSVHDLERRDKFSIGYGAVAIGVYGVMQLFDLPVREWRVEEPAERKGERNRSSKGMRKVYLLSTRSPALNSSTSRAPEWSVSKRAKILFKPNLLV